MLTPTVTNPTCITAFGHNYASVSNGSILVTATGGTAPYTFSINGYNLSYTQNNGYFPNLNAGFYSVVVTDAGGQYAYFTTTLAYAYPLPQIDLIYTLTSASTCLSADASLSIEASGGTPPYLYSIDGGLTYQASGIFTNLNQGYYEGIVKDANGCLVEKSPSNGIGSPGQCGIDGGIAQIGYTACSGDGKITSYASHAFVPYHDTDPWNFSYDGVHYHTPNDGLTQDSTSGISPGINYVWIEDTTTGQTYKAAFTIVKSCFIYITFIGVDASCHQSDGAITVLAANGVAPFTYTMDGIHYQTSNVFTGLASGNYSVTVKDANGQTNSATATVYNKCPTVSATETDAACGQNNGTITATGFKGTLPYAFSIDGVHFQPGTAFSGLASGNYTVTIRDANGFSDSTYVVIRNNCLQLVLNTVDLTCGQQNGSITVSVSNGTAPYQYSIDGVTFQLNHFFTGLDSGRYTITVKDAGGLVSSTDTVLIAIPVPQITADIVPASCDNTGGSFTLHHIGGTPPLLYSIDNGYNAKSDSVFSNLDSAQYVAMAQDAHGCIARDTFRLPALPTPAVTLGDDTVLCLGDTLALVAPVSPGYSYVWQDGSTSFTDSAYRTGIYSVQVTNAYACSASSSVYIRFRALPVAQLGGDTALCMGRVLPLQALAPGAYLWSDGSTGPRLSVSTPGLYWLQVTDSACVQRDSLTVTYKPMPSIALGNDTSLCIGQTLLLTAANPNATYLWQDGSTAPDFTVSAAGDYRVTVTENGCDTTGSINVGNYITKPLVAFTADTTLCVTQQWVIDASYPGATYLWQDGSTMPQYTVKTEGTYTVSVTNSCGTTTDGTVVTFENCACKVSMPSAFTPNGDGMNDIFMPRYTCVFKSYALKVYNRWGQLVFGSENPAIGWDGGVQTTGVYVWSLSYTDSITGKTTHKSGTVVLTK